MSIYMIGETDPKISALGTVIHLRANFMDEVYPTDFEDPELARAVLQKMVADRVMCAVENNGYCFTSIARLLDKAFCSSIAHRESKSGGLCFALRMTTAAIRQMLLSTAKWETIPSPEITSDARQLIHVLFEQATYSDRLESASISISDAMYWAVESGYKNMRTLVMALSILCEMQGVVTVFHLPDGDATKATISFEVVQ